MPRYVGPCKMDCPNECDVPEGFTLFEVPVPRHNWGDVVACPHDDCGRALLITDNPGHLRAERGDDE